MPSLPLDSDIEFTKYQIGQCAYDLFNIALERAGHKGNPHFGELDENHRSAWIEAVWEASQIAKTKQIKTSQQETITLKQRDNGYLVYGSTKLIMKKHPNMYTYAKFPEEIKEEYRQLAMKIYNKIDDETEEIL